jgi:hypothetical protein
MNASNATQAEGISHKAKLFRKRCRFQNTVLVKEIPTHRTYSASERHMSWYTNEELALFNRNKYPNKKTKRSKDCHDVSPKKQHHSGRRPTSPDHDSTLKSLLPSSSLPLFDPSPKTAMRDIDVSHSNQPQNMLYPSKCNATTMREKQLQSIQERWKKSVQEEEHPRHDWQDNTPALPDQKMDPRAKMQHKRQRKPQ